MRMQYSYSKRTPLLATAFCLLLATALGGCASKNPLMEDSAPLAQKPQAETAPATQTEAAQSIAPEQPTASAPVEPAAPALTSTTKAAAIQAAEPSAPVVATDTATMADKNAAVGDTAASTPEVAAKAEAKAATSEASSVRTVKNERFLGFLSPYRPDVQQGNFVSREMVAQLKPGMTQNQVVFLLGTPLLQDVFHQQRWDYVFRMQKGNGDITTSNVTVYFENGVVSRYEGGGDLPTEADYLARIADKAKAAKK